MAKFFLSTVLFLLTVASCHAATNNLGDRLYRLKDGRRVAAPVKGINILKFADGRKEAGYGDFSCRQTNLKSPLRKRLRNQNPFFDKSQ